MNCHESAINGVEKGDNLFSVNEPSVSKGRSIDVHLRQVGLRVVKHFNGGHNRSQF
jgi:hypothetical protein